MLTQEQEHIAELKKWAYVKAAEIAEKNASHAVEAGTRKVIDFDKVMVNALVIFKWLTGDE